MKEKDIKVQETNKILKLIRKKTIDHSQVKTKENKISIKPITNKENKVTRITINKIETKKIQLKISKNDKIE